jgi:hypothetical protein
MPSVTRKAKKSTRPQPSTHMAVKLAMLEQQQDQTTRDFYAVGEKIEKIVDRVEQLTLKSTTLITTHDTQIQILQKQLSGAEKAILQISTGLNDLEQKLSDKIDAHSTRVFDQNQAQHTNHDLRLQKLERWRWMVGGVGLAGGWIISKLVDLFITKL